MIRVRRLRWDPWNVAHVARHGVTPDAVEAACQDPFIARQRYQARLVLIGPRATERMLAVVLEPVEPGVFSPVTARPASRRERRLYEQQKTEP